MREIKFRAWDSEKKYFIDPVFYFIGLDGSAWFNLGGATEDKDSLIDQSDKLEVMQYTGLKDKNGKEIYEGDIVKHETDFNLEVHGEYIMYEILYKSGMWITSFLKSAKGQTLPRGYTAGGISEFLSSESKEIYFKNLPNTDLEIIGNIHENPDLLES